MTHGDLNPRNVIGDGNNIWLIDFEHAGAAPTLMDFARLEANLRLWCLSLSSGRENVEESAEQLEKHLLDHFHGCEGSLEPVRHWADGLGADPQELQKIAHCIAHIRQLALPYCIDESPDRRDYLAVLYVTVLNLLQYACENLAPPMNYRWLLSLAWVLERVLCGIAGLQPFDRKRMAMDHAFLISRDWMRAAQAPQRVKHLLDSEDGRRALAHLAAARGVWQGTTHHLDVFDHTLLVLAYVEGLLEDPLAGFLDPAALDRRVARAIQNQGIELQAIPGASVNPTEPDVPEIAPYREGVRKLLERALDTSESALLLKWVALLHDVGKPGTRSLNQTGKGLKVQFLGHERYGLQLLDKQLPLLFHEDCPAGHGRMTWANDLWTCQECKKDYDIPNTLLARIEGFIRRHHEHHQVTQRYREPRRLNVLKAMLEDCSRGFPSRDYTTGEVADELKFLTGFLQPADDAGVLTFALLMLHGYADSLACRGPDSEIGITLVAEIDLVVLALVTLTQKLWQWEVWEGDFKLLTKGFETRLGLTKNEYRRRIEPNLREFYFAEKAKREQHGRTGPDGNELLEHAGKLIVSSGSLP